MADITQEDEWVMEKGIVAKMYMTPGKLNLTGRDDGSRAFIIRSTHPSKSFRRKGDTSLQLHQD